MLISKILYYTIIYERKIYFHLMVIFLCLVPIMVMSRMAIKKNKI